MSGAPLAGPDPAHPPTVHPPTAVVSGYASLFGSLDDAGDLVMRGAFHRSLRERGPAGIRFLWQHDPARPIGVFEEMREDRTGLFVKGRLLTGTATGREAAVLIAAGALDGLSIGFRARSARRDPHTGIRRLHDIDLWEVSLVTFPLHPGARLAAPGPLAQPTLKHRSLRPS
ncbi:HK97 family phage prohead protease [Stappia taiwanensis]|uniref:HK97 family phage prohead protease n=1 Tax=Stappia taiwanensis TaxID=992267 RepID=A0A838XQC7_9HYPH|nr:HK97 family phage prohead protease [Stappia taiwanensis]MBA4610918.1 HK97 family phage prohead protease [Stappia taiwanensis]